MTPFLSLSCCNAKVFRPDFVQEVMFVVKAAILYNWIASRKICKGT